MENEQGFYKSSQRQAGTGYNNGGWDQSGSNRNGSKLSDSGHIFKTETTGFLEELDVKCERKRRS